VPDSITVLRKALNHRLDLVTLTAGSH
jgi:hypothetical protein